MYYLKWLLSLLLNWFFPNKSNKKKTNIAVALKKKKNISILSFLCNTAYLLIVINYY